MGWEDLLQKANDLILLPWLGEHELRLHERSWTVTGPLPVEHGWYVFDRVGRRAYVNGIAEEFAPNGYCLPAPKHTITGYLAGDRLVFDNINACPDVKQLRLVSEKVHLIDDGLDRFVRINACQFYDNGPLIYRSEEMPLGPESEVLNAFLDRSSISNIKGVTPALEACFRLEVFHREETERRREALEKRRREEEERRQKEAKRQELVKRLGDSVSRREMAKVDFAQAAKAALLVGGAEYLDHRKGRNGEMIVRFRLERRRFECVCDAETLAIISSGICLTDHETGEQGDKYFNLESLPGVVLMAIREGVLHVFRHVD